MCTPCTPENFVQQTRRTRLMCATHTSLPPFLALARSAPLHSSPCPLSADARLRSRFTPQRCLRAVPRQHRSRGTGREKTQKKKRRRRRRRRRREGTRIRGSVRAMTTRTTTSLLWRVDGSRKNKTTARICLPEKFNEPLIIWREQRGSREEAKMRRRRRRRWK